MRYRIRKSDACVFQDQGWELSSGWVVQVWDECDWIDITRPYKSEDEALSVKELLEQ